LTERRRRLERLLVAFVAGKQLLEEAERLQLEGVVSSPYRSDSSR
jgi:hypothetical protein